MNRVRRVLWMGIAAAIVAGGCRKSATAVAPSTAETARKTAPTDRWTPEELAVLKAKFGDLQSTPSGLYFKILQPGAGDATPKAPNRVWVNYRGTFLDGQVFDESRRHGGPYPFRVGIGEVIKGWDETVLVMKKGEKRLVVVPFWLGYGAGFGPAACPRGRPWSSRWNSSNGRPLRPRWFPRRPTLSNPNFRDRKDSGVLN